MIDLDVGRDGTVWGCDEHENIVMREGITEDEKNGLNWVNHSDGNSCVNIAVCTSGHVWAVDSAGMVFFRTGIYKSNLIGDGWED
jgi:hypothetical protein